MNYPRTDSRRRGLHQEFSSFNFTADWDSPSFIRAKTIRSMALSGMQDLNLYEMQIEKPLGIIELLGSRLGTTSTVMLVIFSDHDQMPEASFRHDAESAVGTLNFPSGMFAGILQMVSSPNVYFRIGSGGACNAISTDPSFSDGN